MDWNYTVDLRTYLAHARICIDKNGYQKSDSYEPTKDAAWDSMMARQAKVTPKLEKQVDDLIKWVRSESFTTDYGRNLQSVLSDDKLRPKHMGTAASGWIAYQKEFKPRKATHVIAPAAQVHFGTEEQIFKNVKVEVLFFKHLVGKYGNYTLVKMRESQTGANLTWFDNGKVASKSFRIGDRRTISFKVKKHTVYEGKKDTQIYWVRNH
ncbi:MAG: hypothetical protein AAGM67_01820 [Bacteroidota bacterium]